MFSGNNLLSNNETLLTHNLFKLKSVLDKTRSHSFLENQGEVIPFNLNNSLGAYILSNSINKLNATYSNCRISDLEKSFMLSSVPDSTRLNNKVNLNLSILNQASNIDNTLSNLLNLSIINNLNIAKESR
jgi:hypothetical protein